MKVALIGAGGFIGNRIVEQLHMGTNHQVVPIVRKPYRLALPARFDVEWRLGDALDPNSLATALTGCDAAIHAALGDPRQIEAMPAALCAAAAASGVKRLVYLSTASVHGQAPAGGTNESSPLHTAHSMDYNNAKVRAEQGFFHECSKRQITGFALRPGVVYGPRSRWITDLAQDLRLGQAWLFNGGAGICNSIYVDSLGGAAINALTAPAGAAGPYLVGDNETVTWRDFYHAISDGLGLDSSTIRTVDRLPAFKRSTFEKIQRAVASPGIQGLLPLIPGALKRTTKQLIAATQLPPRPNAWSLPPRPAPRITEELALLQQCTWKFPHENAVERIGYQPRVSFKEAIVRSLAWFAFAEGRA
ncbi:MAG TPA: NAD(P)-dependent oxidoreductase [Lacunisphaera sp.]|jgi:nucleoside-diphosphate-sugar epimerase